MYVFYLGNFDFSFLVKMIHDMILMEMCCKPIWADIFKMQDNKKTPVLYLLFHIYLLSDCFSNVIPAYIKCYAWLCGLKGAI